MVGVYPSKGYRPILQALSLKVLESQRVIRNVKETIRSSGMNVSVVIPSLTVISTLGNSGRDFETGREL